MNVEYHNEWVCFHNGSSRLDIQLNQILEHNIGMLNKISKDVDCNDITKEVYSFYDMRLNHWKQDDLKKAIKILKLFLRNTKIDKDLLYTLPCEILREIYYHRK